MRRCTAVLVVWTDRQEKDHYKTFLVDEYGTVEATEEAARKEYNKVRNRVTTYTAHLARVVASTDYF